MPASNTPELELEEHVKNIRLFFIFLGALFYFSITEFKNIAWKQGIGRALYAGFEMFLPLMLVSIAIGIGLSYGLHQLLSPYRLSVSGVFLAQTVLLRDVAPLPIGFILCIKSALILIDSPFPPDLNEGSRDSILLDTVIPQIIGMNVTGLLLYIYGFAACVISVLLSFMLILKNDMSGYLLRLSSLIEPFELMLSLGKALMFMLIATLISGFYYFELVRHKISVRRAVSKILTRGIFWLSIVAAIPHLIM